MRHKSMILLVALLCVLVGTGVALAQDSGNAAEESQRVFLPLVSSGEEETMLAAGAGFVTVNLLDSQSNGLAGGGVYYYDGGWQLLGTTGTNGQVSGNVPKTTDIEIRYAGGKYKWVLVDPATTPTLTINTVQVTVKLETCDGTPLVGEAKYYFNGWTTIGNTVATIELLPYSGLGPGQGSYDFQVSYNGRTSATQRQDIAVNPVVVFKTTKVNLAYAGPIYYYNNGWQLFTSPMEMIGGTQNYGPNPPIKTADFKFGGTGGAYPTYTLQITGCNISGGLLKLVNEAGNPLANYSGPQYKYRCGGSWGPTTAFQTDANGMYLYNASCTGYPGNWDNRITVTLNQTSLEQDMTVNSTFQAAKVNVNLKSCAGPITEVPGGTVAQGGGYWYTHGTTGPSGTVSFYTFPGNIKVRMGYNHKSPEQLPTIVAGTNNVDFVTTAVTFTYAGDIKSNTGGSWWNFSKPTMSLLPGDYAFYFKNGSNWIGPVTVSVSGCAMNKSLLRVVDENGAGVAGATAVPAIGGAWQSQIPGATDANGNLFVDYNPAWTKIKMEVNGSAREQTSAQMQASNYTWTTEILRIGLIDHAGAPITDQIGFLQRGGGWPNVGYLNASGFLDFQLFAPKTDNYRMNYNVTMQQLPVTINGGPGIEIFNFQTGQVFGSCITQYAGNGWSTFTNGMEQMPGTRNFRNPLQSGTVTAGAITNLSCSLP